MSKPVISIIVPCYNQAQFLDECLQSILDQTYYNWECIIVNDGSPDNTEELATKWVEKDSRFKYSYKENGGLSSARNFGIEQAGGVWIQFLDCDDILEKNKLKNQSFSFIESADVFISGYRYFLHEEGRFKQRIFGGGNLLPEVCLTPDDSTDLKTLFNSKNPFVISAPIYKRSIFESIGLFNEELTSLEDWEFNFRCALSDLKFKHTGYGIEDKVLIRIHKVSMMNDKANMQRNYQKVREILNQNYLYLEQFGEMEQKIIKLTLKEKVALFIPPIFFKWRAKASKSINK